MSIFTESKMHSSWKKRMSAEFPKDYAVALDKFVVKQNKAKPIYPKQNEYFAALNHTHFKKVKVVILGQDPYHGEGQAHGLCFSVKKGVKIPPSLRNIYKEQKRDLGIDQPAHGYLEHWSKQGVLLLNSVLTVEASKAASHQKKGWELFTDEIIQQINEHLEGVVFVLWGAYAQKKADFVDEDKHLILKSVHPSPLSAHRGFIGNGHFSQINEYLESQDKTPIDWQLPEYN
jgi:uracil-DNA glycosylase